VRNHSDGSQNGFTLLEVLIALAIAIPALILLLRVGIESVSAVRTSRLYEAAVARATSRLAALTDRGLVPGERSGEDGDGFRWHTVITPLASTPAPRPAPRNSPYAAGTTLFSITVDESWPGPSGERTLTLASRRLGPSSVAGP
jgi:type II secretory pathway pseudopilin PulG